MLGLGVAANSLPLRCVNLPLVKVSGHCIHSSLVHVHLVDLEGMQRVVGRLDGLDDISCS